MIYGFIINLLNSIIKNLKFNKMKKMKNYMKVIILIFIWLSIMIISWSEYKNELLGFFLIMIHHTVMTYKLIKNIITSWFLKFKNIEILSYMVISTALIKESIWYTNWAVIVNDMMWIDMNPAVARFWVLLVLIILIVLPIYFYEKRKNK